MTERIGVEQYVSFIHQQESIFIRVYADTLQCFNSSWQGIVCNGYLQWRMVLCIVDNVLRSNTLVNAQYRNIIFAVDGLVLYQCHVRHGDNGWNGVRDSQLGSTATCLLLVEQAVSGNLSQKV